MLNKPPKPTGIEFKCLISEKINALIPENVDLSQFQGDRAGYQINPFIFFQEKPKIPLQLKQRLPFMEFTAGSYPVLWVEDPVTKMIMPYWFAAGQSWIIPGLLNSSLSIRDLPLPVFQQLVMAKILIPSYYFTDTFRTETEQNYKKLNNILNVDGYAVLKDIINPLQLSALRKYYRDIENKDFCIRDMHVSKRDMIHNEPVAMFIHYQLNTFINKFVQTQVKPSFCYVSMYREGAILTKHVDREQCVWNLSLLIDMIPEYKVGGWPIYLEVRGNEHEVTIGMGDFIMYQGMKIPHWRNQLPDKHKATVCLYHFVGKDFNGPLN